MRAGALRITPQQSPELSPGRISRQLSAIDFTSHHSSRQRQSSLMSLKAQTHFNTIHNVWVISPHWLPHPHLIRPDASHAYEPTPPSR
ncbi:hypothetical protein O181_080056 [Austropuccinia psidii MF-1]|uniref:Uncharacterized protein n=1 Tax=Austropuccinia psidii MF-1 TaxID=1389203 RepID=A0A9Q3IEK5_9BASI|nr:hypothetical protein [Austropuccinia psidii MF-1]